MKKILLFLIALLSVSVVHADHYRIRGNMTNTNWDDMARFPGGTGKTTSVTLYVTGNFNFGIKQSNDKGEQTGWYKSDQTNTTVKLGDNSASTGGTDNWWFALGNGYYTFTFNGSNNLNIDKPSELWMLYDEGSGWDLNGKAFTKSGDTYTLTTDIKANTYISLSFLNGDWDKVNGGRLGNGTGDISINGTTQNLTVKANNFENNNSSYKITQEGNYTITVTLSTGSNEESKMSIVKNVVSTPTVTLNTASVSNVGYTSATLNYNFSTSNMPAGATYQIKYGNTTKTVTATSGSFEVTGLTEGTSYNWSVTATATASGQTYTSAAKNVNFTTLAPPSTLNLLFNNANKGWNYTGVKFSRSGYVYTVTIDLDANSYFAISESTGSKWEDINNGQYGYGGSDIEVTNGYTHDIYETDQDHDNTTAFHLAQGGNFTITVDFSDPNKPMLKVVRNGNSAQSMYLYYMNSNGWQLKDIKTATSTNNEFVWTLDLTDGNMVTLSQNKSTDWKDINSGQYGPKNTNGSFWVTDAQLAKDHGLENNTKSFEIHAGKGTYTITANFSNSSSPTIKFEKNDAEESNDLEVNIKGEGFNGTSPVSGTPEYYKVTLTSGGSLGTGAAIYYTVDGTAPTSNSTAYSVPFMVVKNCTVKAIAYKDNVKSAVKEESYVVSTNSYSWDNVSGTDGKAEQLEAFTLDFDSPGTVQKDTYSGQGFKNAPVITINPQLPAGMKAEYAWAKYDDFAWYEGKSEYKDEYLDHNEDPTGNYPAGVYANNTNTHIVRTGTNTAYYRFYVQSDDTPSGKNRVNAVHPGITTEKPTRIAYTLSISNPGGATGIEEVITDVQPDDTDAPVYFYNLQGVRVQNPTHGLYIRVQGDKSEKVLVK